MKIQEKKFVQLTAVILLLAMLVHSCKKNAVQVDDTTVITDARQVKLKEVSIQGLPSPYLRYSYDDDRFVTEIGHESGTYLYKTEYRNGRLHKMVNTAFAENDTLYYFYAGKQVSRIDWVAPGNGKREETLFDYDMDGRLITASWRKVNRPDFFKQMHFFYDQQDNMNRCFIFYNMGNGLEKTNEYHYDQFDNKINVTPNQLLKEYHLLFLPQVQLQKNNPLSGKLSGVSNDYAYQYSYQYSGNLPVSITNVMTQTRGSEVGKTITGNTILTYY